LEFGMGKEMDGRWLALGGAGLLALSGALRRGAGSRAEETASAPQFLASPQDRARRVADQIQIKERPAPDRRQLRTKVRSAYRWISTEAIIVPYLDIQMGSKNPTKKDVPQLSDDEAYSAYVLMPLLTLITARRALLLGGPGRGKTTSALVLAIMAGLDKEELRKAIVRGHPQLMVSDLLGQPLPSAIVKAEKLKDIGVEWRSWITKRVKIIDEYNRIPTKTQSALLSLMAEGYAEMYDKYVKTGRSSWFLTANDDLGGGTYQVIEALKDRIDVVVRATPFSPVFADRLLSRMSEGLSPEELVPEDLVFSSEQLEAIYEDILTVEVPQDVIDQIGFLMGALEFCRLASPVFEYKTKDTLKLSGIGGLRAQTVAEICNETCKLDKKTNLCTQTENGISTRALQSLLHYCKAFAWFRGKSRVSMEEVRALLPWVLHDKLVPNSNSQFFKDADNRELLRDRVAWIENMIDMSAEQYVKYGPLREKVRKLLDKTRVGPWSSDIQERMGEIKKVYDETYLSFHLGEQQGGELSGYVYDLVTSLRMAYARYADVLRGKGSGNRRRK
jgi:MoxR-like ATPase